MKKQKLYFFIPYSIFIGILSFLILFPLIKGERSFRVVKAPTEQRLNDSIDRAQKYYEGLYRPFGNNKAVVIEYYNKGENVYTVRHGIIGGMFYYQYTHQATEAALLRNFIYTYGFNPYVDDHSFIWTKKSNQAPGVVYTLQAYHDCNVSLPSFGNIYPYHSKVCKAGILGEYVYIFMSRFDTLLPLENSLERTEEGKKVQMQYFESIYNNLGFGMPICTPLGCSKVASTIRTAQFGLLELRQNNMKYADSVATNLLRAQNKDGAIYISYKKNGELADTVSVIYSLIDRFLNDKIKTSGFIPTNAESMNDALAFLLQYRCKKYNICE